MSENPGTGGLEPIMGPLPIPIILYNPQDIIDACKNNRTIVIENNAIVENEEWQLQKDLFFSSGYRSYDGADEPFKLFVANHDFIYHSELCNYFTYIN